MAHKWWGACPPGSGGPVMALVQRLKQPLTFCSVCREFFRRMVIEVICQCYEILAVGIFDDLAQ